MIYYRCCFCRFFSVKNGDGYGNPPSGTVVDDVVTQRERYDFFLVSQSVRQGTVNPTSYNVIADENGKKKSQARAHPKTHLREAVSSLLQLERHGEGAQRLPVCSQTGLPGGQQCSQRAASRHGPPSLLASIFKNHHVQNQMYWL